MYFLDNGLCGCIARGLENNLFENFKALIFQLRDWFHLNVVSIQILEKEAHPFNHDLMIGPSFVKSSQQFLSWLGFQIPLNIILEILLDGLSVFLVQYLLSLVIFYCAQIVNNSKYKESF